MMEPTLPHACREMVTFVEDPRVLIFYDAAAREYWIPVTDGSGDCDSHPAMQLLLFCPWCGAKLPASLGKRWWDELEELGVVPDEIVADERAWVPERYRTDAWWQGRIDEEGRPFVKDAAEG